MTWYDETMKRLGELEGATAADRAQRATEMLKDVAAVTGQLQALRNKSITELVAGGMSYATVADLLGISKALVAKVMDEGERNKVARDLGRRIGKMARR